MSTRANAKSPFAPTAEEGRIFWTALGRATAAWQFIESSLVQIFEYAVAHRHDAVAAAAFHAPSGFSTRIEMITAAVEQCDIPTIWFAAWKNLRLELVTLSKTRNIVTHGITMFDSSRPHGERLFLTKNLGNPSKREDVFDHRVGVGVSELESNADRYDAAYDRLATFSNYFAIGWSNNFAPRDNQLPEGPLREMFPDLSKEIQNMPFVMKTVGE